MDFPFSFLLAKSCNGPVESPIRCNVTSLGGWVSTTVGKRRETKKVWPSYVSLAMYYKLNLNKLSSKQIQKKTGKIHKKMSEEHCNTLPHYRAGPSRPWNGQPPARKRPRPMLPPSNPRPSLPILPKGPISNILSLYQDHCILYLKGIDFGSTNV